MDLSIRENVFLIYTVISGYICGSIYGCIIGTVRSQSGIRKILRLQPNRIRIYCSNRVCIILCSFFMPLFLIEMPQKSKKNGLIIREYLLREGA